MKYIAKLRDDPNMRTHKSYFYCLQNSDTCFPLKSLLIHRAILVVPSLILSPKSRLVYFLLELDAEGKVSLEVSYLCVYARPATTLCNAWVCSLSPCSFF